MCIFESNFRKQEAKNTGDPENEEIVIKKESSEVQSMVCISVLTS